MMSTFLHSATSHALFILALLLLSSFMLGMIVSTRYWRKRFLEFKSHVDDLEANLPQLNYAKMIGAIPMPSELEKRVRH